MSYDQRHRSPGVFHVDGGQDRPPVPPPRGVPHWSFPAAQEMVSHRRKGRGCLGMNHSGVTVLLMLFVLVFATLAFGAYQIYNLQSDLRLLHGPDSQRMYSSDKIPTHEKQVGFPEPVLYKVKDDVRPAAHVLGRIHGSDSPKTLLWEPQSIHAFVEGGVVYQNGALLVNHTGLYHVYSRVELLGACSQSYVHSVLVRRVGREKPLTLMEGHSNDVCSSQAKDNVRTSDSYLAAALHLQKGDRVFVNSSHPVELSHNPYANFFGLYKI